MRVSERLGLEFASNALDVDLLNKIFSTMLGKNIPYETVSNLALDVHIKSATQMADAVVSGLGGHCVEHAVLLLAVLLEHGFDATYANGDVHDVLRNTCNPLAKAYVLVTIDGDTFACDPFYRRKSILLPREGVIHYKKLVLQRLDKNTVRLQTVVNGDVTHEEVIRQNTTLDDRRNEFKRRYVAFSPFGITAPYFQQMLPMRRALFYHPISDRFVAHDNSSLMMIALDSLDECDWIPASIRSQILMFLPVARRQRDAAIAFLKQGLYTPHYLQLETRATLG